MSEKYLHISAGDGPKECQWVVVKLALAFCKEARLSGVNADILWEEECRDLSPSLMLKIEGHSVNQFANDRIGTVLWIGQSPFRKHHKRKNWFVGVSKVPEIEEVSGLHESDIRYQAMKAAGPGGQHVNATQSAVRATHVPTGLSVVAREERSQHANKRLCRLKLSLLFEAQKSDAQVESKQTIWKANKSLERGNEIRIYEGPKFKLRN